MFSVAFRHSQGKRGITGVKPAPDQKFSYVVSDCKSLGDQMQYETKTADRWPMEMRADTAAEYCDEPSAEAFKAKVRKPTVKWNV